MKGRLSQYFNWHSEHFFPFYLSEHQNPKSRALHYGAAAAGMSGLGASIATGSLGFLAAGIGAGYALAWTGHEKFEKNLPATFKVPMGSLIGDYMMAALWLTGRIDAVMEEQGLDATGNIPVMKDLLFFRDYLRTQEDPAYEPQRLKAQRGTTILSVVRDRLSL